MLFKLKADGSCRSLKLADVYGYVLQPTPLQVDSNTLIPQFIVFHTLLYYTILYLTILYYTILYYTILYYTILYYTILYHDHGVPSYCELSQLTKAFLLLHVASFVIYRTFLPDFNLQLFTQEMTVAMCVGAGCDYLVFERLLLCRIALTTLVFSYNSRESKEVVIKDNMYYRII